MSEGAKNAKKTGLVSAADREYMRRIGEQKRALEDAVLPRSLAEVFDRMEAIERRLGDWAKPGVAGGSEGDLAAHLAFVERKRRSKAPDA